MAQKISKRALKHDEFVETAFDAGHWIEEHWQLIAAGVAVVIVGLLVFAGVQWWRASSEDAAEAKLAEGLTFYASGTDLDKALDAFRKASGGTPAGEVAQFYVGATQLREGKAREAAQTLEKAAADADSRALADTSRALAAEAYRRAGDLDKAASIWRALSQATDGVFPPPVAKVRLGDVLAAQGKTDEAKQAWRDVVNTSPQEPIAEEARTKLGEGRSQSAQ